MCIGAAGGASPPPRPYKIFAQIGAIAANSFIQVKTGSKASTYLFFKNIMNLELVAQLVSLFLILGAGPIVIVLLFARGGNL